MIPTSSYPYAKWLFPSYSFGFRLSYMNSTCGTHSIPSPSYGVPYNHEYLTMVLYEWHNHLTDRHWSKFRLRWRLGIFVLVGHRIKRKRMGWYGCKLLFKYAEKRVGSEWTKKVSFIGLRSEWTKHHVSSKSIAFSNNVQKLVEWNMITKSINTILGGNQQTPLIS